MEKYKVVLIFTTLAVSSYAMADTTASGFDINKCTKCHTEVPEKIGSIFPRLAGQSPDYFINTLSAYKNGKRHSYDAVTLMSTKRVTLSAATIKQLSEYFSKLTP